MTTMPEKLAPGIYRVDTIPIRYMISVLLIAERDGWTLIDTGVASSVPRIQAALGALGGDATTLRRIYLTHQHVDHIGGLEGLAAWAPDAEIIAPRGKRRSSPGNSRPIATGIRSCGRSRITGTCRPIRSTARYAKATWSPVSVSSPRRAMPSAIAPSCMRGAAS